MFTFISLSSFAHSLHVEYPKQALGAMTGGFAPPLLKQLAHITGLIMEPDSNEIDRTRSLLITRIWMLKSSRGSLTTRRMRCSGRISIRQSRFLGCMKSSIATISFNVGELVLSCTKNNISMRCSAWVY
jgi:hypothetical protein